MHTIRKTRVIDGVYWIEVPEAELRILCGCPADAIKHLSRKGLIHKAEQDGARCETGPNAILLSDVLIQNGQFSNLSEFPVLQMLYRQGMLLPEHPNVGKKPLLIGSAEQVAAQMRYIYRGNYGLVSQEEMMEAGVSAERAAELMRLKRRFAFDHIRPPEELLNTLTVRDRPIEIRNGVSIRRLRLNVFEFRYRSKSVTIDLNLAVNHNYPPPYRLPYHQIQREHFAVIHSGEGNGWDARQPCMSSVLMYKGKLYLIDAGPNLLYSLTALGISINEIDGIFHTHAHDDHFAGLPTLIRSGKRIKYYSTALVRASVTKKLFSLLNADGQRFTDFFEVHDLEFDRWTDLDGLEVQPVFSPHPVETNIFYFRTRTGSGYRSYAHLADIISLDKLKAMVTLDEAASGLSPDFYARIERAYRTPANLKKIDIGGGMIHGIASDFRSDRSGRLVFSHTDRDATGDERTIGVRRPFGATDVLICADRNYLYDHALTYLESYFDAIPRPQMQALFGNPVIHFAPGDPVLRQGEAAENLFLILSGTVRLTRTHPPSMATLCAGSLIGEEAHITGGRCDVTVLAASHVQALVIPHSRYTAFVRANRLDGRVQDLSEKRAFLQKTALFGEAVPYPTLNRVAETMHLSHYRSGERVPEPSDAVLNLVRSGRLERRLGVHSFTTIARYDFFGEATIVCERSDIDTVTALDDATTYRIPFSAFREIPVVRWKLIEACQKTMNEPMRGPNP